MLLLVLVADKEYTKGDRTNTHTHRKRMGPPPSPPAAPPLPPKINGGRRRDWWSKPLLSQSEELFKLNF